ncbi:hypothetical protein N7486_003041 [Penicillium sp. IBT 16267x]|nr:hypothetical protein N7486_003041 [Penicillium sp. IBT 16267x]
MIRNDDRFLLRRVMRAEFHDGIHGFEPLSAAASDSRVIPKVMTQKITRSLVAQVQAKVFLNEDFSRDPAWLQITLDISHTIFMASRILRRWPYILRPYVVYFLPSCRKLRKQLEEAQRLLNPFIARRVAAGASEPKSQSSSTIDWFMDAYEGSASELSFLQLGLTIASLDTTSTTLCNFVVTISRYPDLVNDLRAEVVRVIGEHGLNKQSLQKLELMDSALKESQRVNPLAYFGLQRRAIEDVILPDGLRISKDSFIMVPSLHTTDPSVWPDAESYDAYRFLNMRGPATQFISTSADHLGFGHGKQACPGRFFASQVIKIFLCHMLLKYDFEVIEPEEGRSMERGYVLAPHPKLSINLRRREEEFGL